MPISRPKSGPRPSRSTSTDNAECNSSQCGRNREARVIQSIVACRRQSPTCNRPPSRQLTSQLWPMRHGPAGKDRNDAAGDARVGDQPMVDASSHATIWSLFTSEIPLWGFDHGVVIATVGGRGVGALFTTRLEAIRQTKLYDLLAATPFIIWLMFWASRMIPSLTEQIALAGFFFFKINPSALPVSLVLVILSKLCTLAFLSTLVIVFALRRVPTGRAQGFYPRFVALVGTFSTFAMVWLEPRELSPTLHLISLLLMIGGTAFALSAVLALGRSISLMPEVRKLITRGPYAFLRHPLYVGEMVATAGLAIQFLMPWAFVLLGLSFMLQFERMRNEERLLVNALPCYRDYMANTARFLPGIF